MASEIRLSALGSFKTQVTTADHTWTIDEPLAAGGTNAGPTPYDLLAAALGGCTAMTLHFYAKREGLPLEGVELTVSHDRKHAQDCADCVTRGGYIHHFEVKLDLRGPLTDDQKQKLLGVARRCPVYKTLTSEIRIDEVLV